MKLLLNIYLFLLICISAYSQHQENANTIIKQNHFTKEIVFLYSYSNNVAEKIPNGRDEIAYNNEGYITERKFFHNDKLQRTNYFFYDSLNKLLKEVMYLTFNKTKPFITSNYKYDINGNEIGTTDSGYQGSTPPNDTIKFEGHSAKTYNNKNELILEIYNNEHFYSKKLHTYNIDGTINKIFYYSQNDELSQTETYIYKRNGNIEINVLNKAGKSKKTVEKFYNQNKQLVKQIAYFYKSNITEYSYNTDGTLFEKKSSFNGIDINLERHYYRPIGTNLNF